MQGGIGTLNCKLHWCPNFSTFTLRSLHQYQYFGLDEIHILLLNVMMIIYFFLNNSQHLILTNFKQRERVDN